MSLSLLFVRKFNINMYDTYESSLCLIIASKRKLIEIKVWLYFCSYCIYENNKFPYHLKLYESDESGNPRLLNLAIFTHKYPECTLVT